MYRGLGVGAPRPRLAWGKTAAPAALRGFGDEPAEVYGYWPRGAVYRRPLLVGFIGQDMPELSVMGAPTPDVLPYDASLPYADRPGLVINRGCAGGYFAQFQPPGDSTATHVTIPGVATDSWLRCRLMASTTARTIADESGEAAAQSWYNYTNTGAGGLFGGFLEQLGTYGKWAIIGVAVVAGGALALRVLR